MITNVVVEGSPMSGKSTIAKAISDVTGWPLIESAIDPEGIPARNALVEQWLDKEGFIMDGHPLVKNSIRAVISRSALIPPDLHKRFAAQGNLIVFCRCLRPVHYSTGDNGKDEIQRAAALHAQVVLRYDQFAMNAAHILYRRYGDSDLIVRMVGTLLETVERVDGSQDV